ncbi:hypothetical protein D1122_19490 [Cereibacter sphaeroides]|nr:hypothetical protein D1122_19490 [Cereibacter sphaeroides]
MTGLRVGRSQPLSLSASQPLSLSASQPLSLSASQPLPAAAEVAGQTTATSRKSAASSTMPRR